MLKFGPKYKTIKLELLVNSSTLVINMLTITPQYERIAVQITKGYMHAPVGWRSIKLYKTLTNSFLFAERISQGQDVSPFQYV